jgi:hypothetical protein
MKVYVIRKEYQLDFNLLNRHFNHVNMLVAIYCNWD